eukprot:m.19868 g.19868  ORF g.19868 m.19868 type:complete len:375 (+) comp3732_c0_seq1:982-2106(+)
MATIVKTTTQTQTQQITLQARVVRPHAAVLRESTTVTPKESGWIDALMVLDERLSLPILKLPSLGRLEYVLSLPGSMFGVPMYSLVLLPFVVAAFAEVAEGTRGGFAVTLAAVMVTLASAFWAACLVESLSNPPEREGTGIMRAFAPLGKKLGTAVTLGGPHVTVWLVGQSSSVGRSAAAFYITVFFVTQVAVEFLKTVSRRLRPVIKVKSDLQGVERALPQLQHFLSREHAMYASFPSGDAAGSTTFATVGVLLVPHEYRWMAIVFFGMFPLLSTFARVYFQAHFLGDVLAGHLVAAAVAAAFLTQMDVAVTEYAWGSLALWEIPVILGWYVCQKMKPKTAENIYSADNLMQSFSFRRRSSSSASLCVPLKAN